MISNVKLFPDIMIIQIIAGFLFALTLFPVWFNNHIDF